MGFRKLGVALIVIGVLTLGAVLLVTPLYIYGTGFGHKHIIGAIASAIVLVFGIVVFLFSKPKPADN